jgi:hypothetical protein
MASAALQEGQTLCKVCKLGTLHICSVCVEGLHMRCAIGAEGQEWGGEGFEEATMRCRSPCFRAGAAAPAAPAASSSGSWQAGALVAPPLATSTNVRSLLDMGDGSLLFPGQDGAARATATVVAPLFLRGNGGGAGRGAEPGAPGSALPLTGIPCSALSGSDVGGGCGGIRDGFRGGWGGSRLAPPHSAAREAAASIGRGPRGQSGAAPLRSGAPAPSTGYVLRAV